ncbi:MAG TPA: hypothetical protein VF629_16895 [Hymenobacter sp.]|uniref:hypothetical protein n=1 Tax=Hymenobacter sp. TaxID=1898978 RepID=UPI002EDA5CE1
MNTFSSLLPVAAAAGQATAVHLPWLTVGPFRATKNLVSDQLPSSKRDLLARERAANRAARARLAARSRMAIPNSTKRF